jgi:hypothetical protein
MRSGTKLHVEGGRAAAGLVAAVLWGVDQVPVYGLLLQLLMCCIGSISRLLHWPMVPAATCLHS